MHVLQRQETCMAKQEQEGMVGKHVGMEDMPRRKKQKKSMEEEEDGRTDGRANDEGRCVRLYTSKRNKMGQNERARRRNNATEK